MATVGYRIGKLDPARSGHPLELFEPGTGAALGPSAWLPAAEVQSTGWNPQKIRQTFADPASIKKHLHDAGAAMFQWLDHAPIGAAWRAYRRAGALTLLDIQEPDLQDLPWELAADQYVQLFGVESIARFHIVGTGRPAIDGWPLRLWIVNGAPNDQSIKIEEEIRKIRADLLWHRHSIDIKVDTPADAAAFDSILEEFHPHVLHFVGHGGMSPTSDLPALFVASKTPWELDALRLTTAILTANVAPRLVFLNACRTAASGHTFGLTRALAAAGVRGTLTMQGDVQGKEAGGFAAAVYKLAATGAGDLVEAVRRARSTFDPGKPHHWAFPVLSLNGPAANLLPTPPAGIDQRFTDSEACKIFEQVRMFSGRTDERRRLRTAFCPIEDGRKPSNLVVITGGAGHGKSHMAKRCLDCLNLRGINTQYVEVSQDAHDQLTLLLQVLKPVDDGLARPTLERAYARFTWEAQQILDRGALTPWDGTAKARDPLRFEPSKLKSEDALTLLADAFLATLRDSASKDAPIVIALDKFRNDNGELAVAFELFEKFLWPSVLSRVHRGDVPHVYVSLLFRAEDAEHVYRMHEKIDRQRWLTVDDLPREQLDELADELFGYSAETTLPGFEHLLNFFKASAGTVPTARLLQKLLQTADEANPDKPHRKYVGRSR